MTHWMFINDDFLMILTSLCGGMLYKSQRLTDMTIGVFMELLQDTWGNEP